jgi:hypothetical protein
MEAINNIENSVTGDYYSRPEVSNSDLTWLSKYWMPENKWVDLVKAYANGTLIDAMITEPHRVDYFKLKVANDPYQFSAEEFNRAKEMKKAFYRDQFCQMMIQKCSFQKISVRKNFPITYDGFEFTLDARAKWDLFCEHIDLGGDIKSTVATTQKQAEEAARYFDYPRSRSWYMDLENRNNDILIFISKENFKIFKIPIKRGDDLYKEGKARYQELSFQFWTLFGKTKA